MIVTSGRAGFCSAFFELLLFLLFEVMLAVYAICTASRYGFLGCKLKCLGYIIKRGILVFSYCLVISFLSGVLCFCSWKENFFMFDYFETELQKPGGPVCQGNLAVYYLFTRPSLESGSGVPGL